MLFLHVHKDFAISVSYDRAQGISNFSTYFYINLTLK